MITRVAQFACPTRRAIGDIMRWHSDVINTAEGVLVLHELSRS